MTYKEIAKGFVSLHIYGRCKTPLRGRNCRVVGNMFISYGTPIAMYNSGKFYLVTEKYSTTTSKHQNALLKEIPSDMLVEVRELRDKNYGVYIFL